MEGLFYSTKEKKLFYIPPYYCHGTGELENLRKNLTDCESVLRKYQKEGDIYCDLINVSRRYKSNWYFFSINCENPPKEAFQLGDNWTMFQWIRD